MFFPSFFFEFVLAFIVILTAFTIINPFAYLSHFWNLLGLYI